MRTDLNRIRSSQVGRQKLSPRSASREPGGRNGLSMVVVIIALTASLILTMAFTRTQSTNLLMTQNRARRDLAYQAAQTGAMVALKQMQSVEWEGIGELISRTTHVDDDGTAKFFVVFEALTVAEGESQPADLPLYLVIRSTGNWQSASVADLGVEREVEVTVKLLPRVPGREILVGDNAVANDVAANPGNYDAIQDFTLFANTSSGSALVLDPGNRIEGPIWLGSSLQLYGDPPWSDNVRSTMLESIGATLGVAGGTGVHPHPLGGQITFNQTPSESVVADLAAANVPWVESTNSPSIPSVSFSQFLTYRLYDGGFEYQADVLPGNLAGVTLRPTPTNPLGIYYYDGHLDLFDDVAIQGTLVCTEQVHFKGKRIYIGAYNWRGQQGEELSTNSTLWPRLPAIVTDDVDFEPDTRVAIDGAIIASGSVNGFGENFEYISVADVNIQGTATSTRLQQPWSLVHLEDTPDLSALDSSGNYSIWLQSDDGTTGRWYPIVGLEELEFVLKVVGEVEHATPTSYKIRPSRYRSADLNGPIATARCEIDNSPSWIFSSNDWDQLWTNWDTENELLVALELQPIEFADYLADPANFSTWSNPQSQYGLPLEPTVHIGKTLDVSHRLTPPLFAAFDDDSVPAFGGYRWKVISWRDLP